jgi:hypothetical protein
MMLKKKEDNPLRKEVKTHPGKQEKDHNLLHLENTQKSDK